MEKYLDLDRRFAFLEDYAVDDFLRAHQGSKRLTWDEILAGRFSVVVGRANFGKTFEFMARNRVLRSAGQSSIFVALHAVLGEEYIEDALATEERDALAVWRQHRGVLTVFVDSLDEASLAAENGVRKALLRVAKALDWPTSEVRWVFSSRPAVLTDEILGQIIAELRTTLYQPANEQEDEPHQDGAESSAAAGQAADGAGAVASADPASKRTKRRVNQEPLKMYVLLPLDRPAATRYLAEHARIAQPAETLSVARRYGLERLADSPGGLDILGHIDPVRSPPRNLTQVFGQVADAMQLQQRVDPREPRLGHPPPKDLERAVERLAAASVVCGLLNIELSTKPFGYRDGVLSALPLVGTFLPESALRYLLGSRLFIDSGQHQVKLYPDDLLPFLAAKHLAGLVASPEHARKLMASFTWRATTGECGFNRGLLTLAGWLSVFSVHCRQLLIDIEPQAVAFFGDLRNPQIPLADASRALERTIERLVHDGDSIGRRHFTLTAENYWQAAKPGIEPTLERLFDKFGADLNARDVLLDIAGHARFDLFRAAVLAAYEGDYARLLDVGMDLAYILALGEPADLAALAAALQNRPDLPESRMVQVLGELAWKTLDAKAIAMLVAEQFRRGRGGFSIDWALTKNVAPAADDHQLYRLVVALLLRLARAMAGPSRSGEHFRSDQKFVELIIDLLALLINRFPAAASKAAKLCLVLNRIITKHHHGNADANRLRSALKANKAARLALLRGLIAPTDKSPGGVNRAVFLYHSLYSYVERDELELGEPGFSELIESWKRNPAEPPAPPIKRRDRTFVIDQDSKAVLRGMLPALRNATAESAFAWVGHWLLNTIEDARYGDCRYELFERAAGAEIAQAVRAGLSNLWRRSDPVFKEDEPHSTYNITIAGLQGLFLDLGDGSTLPYLSELDVRRAIRYAQFEINGYPQWFWRLVAAHEPIAANELGTVLANASQGAVSQSKAETLMRHLDGAPTGVRHHLAQAAWNFVLATPSIGEYAAKVALRIAATGSGVIGQSAFEAEAARLLAAAFKDVLPDFDGTAGPEIDGQMRQELINQRIRQRANALVWAGLWITMYPASFSAHWMSWRTSERRAAEDFMLALATHLGQERGAQLVQVAEQGSDGLRTLKMLYDWVHTLVKVEDDLTHDDGHAYAPSERDHAQRLRDTVVPAIAHAKSEQAYQVLEEMRREATDATAKYLRHVQFNMREEQFALPPLKQTDYPDFEQSLVPHISSYMAFALAVESDLLNVKHQIETGDFSLRRFFNAVNFARIKTDKDGLALEEDFQALLGSELNHAAAGRYVVALEAILPSGTRRDVLCQVDGLKATVELKMSIRWTIADYIEALEMQLQGQYMMAENSKIGFFVVVLQKNRAWVTPEGTRIGFEALLEILRAKARGREAADSSLFLRVIGIDATPKADFRLAKKHEDAGSGGAILSKYTDGPATAGTDVAATPSG